MGKRHLKGVSKADEKRRRKEFADNWKKVRGDGKPNDQDQAVPKSELSEKMHHRGDGWNTSNPQNDRFEAFYKCQGFLVVTDDPNSDNSDWDKFIQYLRLPLPACFRICPDFAFAQSLREQLLTLSLQASELQEKGREIDAVEKLKWVPNGSAYKLGTDRRSIRKLECLQNLHKWYTTSF